MADLVLTGIEVASSRSRGTTVQAGEAISAGELVYLNTATSKYELADASAAATANVAGIAVTDAASDGYFLYVANEDIDLGAILTAGTHYYLSATAGKICPFADLVSTNVVSQIGYATTTSNMKVSISNTEVAIA